MLNSRSFWKTLIMLSICIKLLFVVGYYYIFTPRLTNISVGISLCIIVAI